jgi:hypothetical protein
MQLRANVTERKPFFGTFAHIEFSSPFISSLFGGPLQPAASTAAFVFPSSPHAITRTRAE